MKVDFYRTREKVMLLLWPPAGHLAVVRVAAVGKKGEVLDMIFRSDWGGSAKAAGVNLFDADLPSPKAVADGQMGHRSAMRTRTPWPICYCQLPLLLTTV
ncbi:hypothetical protein ACLOJK_035123 [Asimina triloba]